MEWRVSGYGRCYIPLSLGCFWSSKVNISSLLILILVLLRSGLFMQMVSFFGWSIENFDIAVQRVPIYYIYNILLVVAQ